jgi:hypothetical protein
VRSIHVTRIDDQRSGGVVTSGVQSFVQSLHQQRRDLYQSTYLYLVQDREPTSHHTKSHASKNLKVIMPSLFGGVISEFVLILLNLDFDIDRS